MKVKIDKDNCICCGMCVETCPEVFQLGEDGYAQVYCEPTPLVEDKTHKAAEKCPVSVISVS